MKKKEAPKHLGKIKLQQNAILDKGDGVIQFDGGLTITDGSEQWNGTKYDMESYSIKNYNGQLTADHNSSIESILGRVIGTKKEKDRVSIKGIKFAIEESALARFAYNMILGGFITDFSTETIGPWPDEDNVYRDAELVGLSAVVVGNNKKARINEIAMNSIREAEEAGLDSEPIKAILKYPIDSKKNNPNNDINMKFVTIKNSRDFAISVNYKNAAGEDIKVELTPNAFVDVSEDQKEAVEKQINEAQAPKVEINVEEAVKNAVAPLMTKIQELETKAFNNGAQEPKFVKQTNTADLKGQDSKTRTVNQIEAARVALKTGSRQALETLNEINEIHLEELKEAGKVANSMTIADFGNFVISREMLTEIEGYRSNFQPLLSRTNWRETLSTQMAWISRTGDIDMQSVEFCDDGADGNLKPISEYGASIETADLEELAAVTPVCNAATRFLAVDLLSDIAAGYRNDYDRKRAQLIIARLQQAVNETGNTTVYNTAAASALNPLNSLISAASEVAERVPAGVWIFNTATYYELLRRRMAAGTSQDQAFDLFTTGDSGAFLGNPYIVVPNELMPTLNTAQTKTFVVDGANVTITQAMFFVDLNTFTGRTSGGLIYDLSTDAAYEDGETVKSAFQRNELVLRGSFFRGGAVTDPEKVAGVGAPGVS